MAKKILIFSFVYYPRFIGGAEIAIKEITDRINSNEIEFDLIALRIDKSLPKFERIGNINVYRIGFSGKQNKSSDSLSGFLHLNKYLYPFLAALKANQLNKKEKYNAIWGMMANYSGFGALLFKLGHISIPFILTLQEGDPIDYIKKRVRFVSPLFRMIFTRADSIQTISNYLSDFAKNMGAIAKPIVIPNGVDVKSFQLSDFSEKDKNNLRLKFNISFDDNVLITTSRLVVKNAVGDIIESLLYLPSNTKLLILGTGYQEEELRVKVDRLGLTQKVNFLGFVSHSDMPKYLKISDVFIRPSLSEGFGNSFIEAMASGLPVIATSVGGIIDFLKNKETGLFCEVNDPKDIARKVEIYLRDINLRKEIVDNAMHMVIDKYDWNIVAKDMKEKVFDKS